MKKAALQEVPSNLNLLRKYHPSNKVLICPNPKFRLKWTPLSSKWWKVKTPESLALQRNLRQFQNLRPKWSKLNSLLLHLWSKIHQLWRLKYHQNCFSQLAQNERAIKLYSRMKRSKNHKKESKFPHPNLRLKNQNWQNQKRPQLIEGQKRQ